MKRVIFIVIVAGLILLANVLVYSGQFDKFDRVTIPHTDTPLSLPINISEE